MTSRRSLRAIPAGSRAAPRTRSSAGRWAAPASGGCSGADLTLQTLRDSAEILDKGAHLELAGFVIGRTKDRRGMDRRHHQRQPGSFDELPALQGNPKVAAELLLRRGGPQQYKEFRLNHGDLGVEPGPAGIDFGGVGLLMQPSLALGLPLEVLDGVGHVHLGAIDAGRLERLIQHPAGGSDEGLALPILAVAGLLADEHRSRLFGPFTEDGLGS